VSDVGNFGIGELKGAGNFAAGTVSLGFWRPFSAGDSAMQGAGMTTGYGLAFVGTLFAPFASAGASAGAAASTTGDVCVYESVNAAGDTQYVGISSNFARRAVQHAARFDISKIRGLANLTRDQARAVEQVLIEHHALAKNGGTLLNRINSIAQSNPKYANALREGRRLLHDAGYPGF
jgi:hypothetical protein